MAGGELQLGVIILAAGASVRMGRPKLLLPWGKTSVLGHILGQWKRLGAGQICVVHASAGTAVLQELDRLGVPENDRITNPSPQDGMFSSLRCAAEFAGWQASIRHIAVVLGDQPHLGLETLQQLLAFGAAHPANICQPSFDGRPRHPVLMPRELFLGLRHTPAASLKEFLAAHSANVRLCETRDAGFDLDLDTPADYEQLRRQFSRDA